MENDGALHVAVFPWLAFGHLIPFLELSKSLAKRGHRVSFISTPRNIRRLTPIVPPKLAPLIDLIPIPLPPVDGLPPEAESTNDLFPHQIEFLKKAFDGLRSPFARFLQSSPRKPDWLLLDFSHHWAPPIASELNVPCAYFSILPALSLTFFWGDVVPAAERGGRRRTPEELTKVPNWVPFPSNIAYLPHEARGFLGICQDNASGISDCDRFSLTLKGCRSIVVRSCPEVEPRWIDLVGELYKMPAVPAGLLPPGSGGEEEDEKNSGGTELPPSESMILAWLSEQPSRSVVFVAFGSEGALSAEMQKEVALGLELAKTPFLWAVRRPADSDSDQLLPAGFEARTRGYGLVTTGWVPQLQVLGHPSVGAFFTFCGWSSVIESFHFGHPLVMLPSIIDQGLISRHLSAEEVGAAVARDEQDGSFTREDVAAAIRKVMAEGGEGKVFRSNARKLQQVFANKTLHESYVDRLIEHLRVETFVAVEEEHCTM